MIFNRLAWLLFALLLGAGCSSHPAVAPVDVAQAQAALTTALDAWKAGRPIKQLATDSPPIVAQDFDWLAGAVLEGYDVLEPGTPQDANLRVPVRLRLRGKSPKTVYYIVGTDKTLTVFRALE